MWLRASAWNPLQRRWDLKGIARLDLGDAGGLNDCAEALALAKDRGHGWEAASLYNTLGSALSDFEGPRSAFDAWNEGVKFSEQRGIAEWGHHMKQNIGALALVEMGLLDQALDLLTTLGREFETLEDDQGAEDVACDRLTILLLRGEARPGALRGALSHTTLTLEAIDEQTRELAGVVFSLYRAALFAAATGDCESALVSLRRITVTSNAGGTELDAPCLPQLVRTALKCRDLDVAEQLLAKSEARTPYAELAAMAAEAAIAEAQHNIQEAVESYSVVAPSLEAVRAHP